MNIEHPAAVPPAHRGTAFPFRVMRAGWIAIALVLGGSAAASADPVRIITSGHAYQLVEDGETGFLFRGEGFQFIGELQPRFAESCGPCAPGSTLSLSATMTPALFPPSYATIDGHTYDEIYFAGTFDFDAGSVIVPNVPLGGPSEFPEARFTFTGTLAGYSDIGLTGPPLFTTDLAGQGTGRRGFHHYPSNGFITEDGFSYEFDSTAPVPEPGSLLLFGSGAAWVASRRRRAGSSEDRRDRFPS